MTGKGPENETLLGEILGHLNVTKGPDARGEYVAWCPFHEDGKGKPPHQPNLSVSVRGFYCHACGAKGGLRKLAEHLGMEVPTMQEFEATYDYKDRDGKLLYQQTRRPGKEFRFRRPDGKGGWIWNLHGVGQVLYRLPELVAHPDKSVFIVEGEKDADRLAREGLLATTNPSGAGKWKKEYSQTLKGRDVVILPDNDEPGKTHGQEVAKSLHGIAKSVKVVDLPGLSEKGDVSDWLEAGHTVEELQALVSQTPEWLPQAQDDERIEGAESGEDKTQADLVLEAIIASGIELFVDERDKPYAAIPSEKGRRTVSMDAPEFGDHVSYLAYVTLGKVANSETLGAVRRNLQGIARYEGKQHTLHVRVAWHEGAIWIDKDGYKAIRVTEEGWGIVDDPPILFRSFSHQKPLPDPVRGGDPRKLLDFVNIQDHLGRLAIMCYVPAAMVPDIPCNALILYGGQGTAKSTLLRVIKMLLDPSELDLNMDFKKLEQFVLPAWQCRMLNIDNLTSIPKWLSNALCCTVTGAAQATRSHYTMEQLNILKIKRVVGLSGINLVADRPDFLERSTILALDPIAPCQRREESEFWRAFEEAYPSILGGFLDVLSEAMRIRPSIELERPPRMKDFARWGAAAAVALGHTVDEFQEVIDWTCTRQNEAAVEASSLAQAVIAMMNDSNKADWHGAPADFLESVTRTAFKLRISTNSKSWPKNPTWAVRRLNEVKPSLSAVGIEVDVTRERQGSVVHIWKVPLPPPAAPCHPVTVMTVKHPGPENSVTLEPASRAGCDRCDASDAIFPNIQEGTEEKEVQAVSADSEDEFEDIRHLLSIDLGKSEVFDYGW
jgi:hypothetical protein